MFIQIKLFSMVDLIRLIKLKKINGELNNLSDEQKLFISEFDKLNNKKIKKDRILNVFYGEYTDVNKHHVFRYFNDYDVTVSYSLVENIQQQYNMSDSEMEDLIRNLFKNYLHLQCNTVYLIF